MATSERFEAVLALGEKIVDQLGLADTNDVLSRWMAHYVAEQIENARTATGAEQEERKRECKELILQLWKLRRDLPDGKRPFEEFESVLTVLANLAPSAPPHIYVRSGWLSDAEEAVMASSKDWLPMISGIDSAATAMISYCVEIAIQDCVDAAREWVNTADAAGTADEDDLKAVRHLLEINIEIAGSDQKPSTREDRLLERLEQFEKIAHRLRELARHEGPQS